MNENIKLLDYIYQNSEMGTNTISQLMEKNEDSEFQKHLQAQWKEYKHINDEAKDILNDKGVDEKGISSFDKMKTYLMINMQTMSNNSVPHIAEMMIIGSGMGIVDAVKRINEYKDSADSNVLQLMNRLKVFEEDNVERLKKFL